AWAPAQSAVCAQPCGWSWYASIGIRSFTASAGAYGRPAVIPQSERLITAVASPPHIGFLLYGCGPQRKSTTVSATGFVTPSIVSSPSTPTTRSPSNLTLFDLNVIVGYFSTLKYFSPLTTAS